MIAASFGAGVALLLAAAPVASVHPEARADAPWCAAVLAMRAGRAAPTCGEPAIAALVARGARCALSGGALGTLVSLEGPPELEPAFVDALGRHEGAVFVEGRTRAPLSKASDLPAPRAAARKVGGLSLELAPSPSLFGLEGAALVLLLDDALVDAPAPPGHARVSLDAERAQVLFHLALSDADAAARVRRAIDGIAARPPTATQAQRVWTRARGQLAARDAVVGVRATTRARAWLATGSDVLDSAADHDAELLLARLRARVFGAALSTPSGSR